MRLMWSPMYFGSLSCVAQWTTSNNAADSLSSCVHVNWSIPWTGATYWVLSNCSSHKRPRSSDMDHWKLPLVLIVLSKHFRSHCNPFLHCTEMKKVALRDESTEKSLSLEPCARRSHTIHYKVGPGLRHLVNQPTECNSKSHHPLC